MRRTNGESSVSTSMVRRAAEASRLVGRGREMVLLGLLVHSLDIGWLYPGNLELELWELRT